MRAYQEGYRAGRAEGIEFGRQVAEMGEENLRRRVADLEEKLDRATRRHAVDGHQAVEVDGYAYLWTGAQPLEVGERVLLPENYVSNLKHGPGPFVGVVTVLGTTSTVRSRAYSDGHRDSPSPTPLSLGCLTSRRHLGHEA